MPSSGTAATLGDMPGSDDHGSRDAEAQAAERRPPLDLLYRDHASRLTRRVRARVGSTDEASDLVHEAFTRLLGVRAVERVRDPAAFLNRILRNLLIDRSRRLSARPQHVELDSGVEVGVPPTQSDAIEVEQMRDRYREIVASLPTRMREVFILHRIDGLSYREIALRLDISVRTVEWHIAEAIVRISRGLDGE